MGLSLTTPLCPQCGRAMFSGTVDTHHHAWFCPFCRVLNTVEDGKVTRYAPAQRAETDTSLATLFEQKFAAYCPALIITEREARVVPERRFRWDYVIEAKVAVEIDGLCHRTRERYWSDMRKHNVATLAGWTWLRTNRAMLTDEKTCEQFFTQLQELVRRTPKR